MKEKIMSIINESKEYSQFLKAEDQNMFRIAVEAIESCDNDNDVLDTVVNYIFSMSLMYEYMIATVGEYGDDNIKEKIASIINKVFTDAEEEESNNES